MNLYLLRKVKALSFSLFLHNYVNSGQLLNYVYIQGVTGSHRQNDRDDRPCREDHFFVKEYILANMSFMSYAQVKVFARKGRN